MTPTKPGRAPKGSIDSGSTILLRLSADLRTRLDKAAKKEGLSVSEWIRRAVEAILPKK
jgi:hypothetical protein